MRLAITRKSTAVKVTSETKGCMDDSEAVGLSWRVFTLFERDLLVIREFVNEVELI